MLVTKYVVYAEMCRTKGYVVKSTLRDHDKKHLPYYATDIKEALQFDTDIEAYTFISSIFNMHFRDFKVEPVEVMIYKTLQL